MSNQAIFIAATGQNVGKTTLCLGILACLQKRFDSVGVIKPVGQEHVQIRSGVNVDKDVILFREYFQLKSQYEDMSPIIFPPGFTKQFLEGKVKIEPLRQKVKTCFEKIASENDYTIVEGTGHVGVGSIIDLNNARVAAELGLDMVIIASAGLGSAHDEIALNIAMCEKYGVKVRGVILNRVLPEKRDMILDFFPKALEHFGVPLIGCIPYNDFLSNPTMQDFEWLFKTRLINGEEHRLRHFSQPRLVAGSVDIFEKDIIPNELIITPASRNDIIDRILSHHRNGDERTAGGVILTGRYPPTEESLNAIKSSNIPFLYAPMCSYDAMKKITGYIAKIRTEDTSKVEKAIQLVEKYVDLDALCQEPART